MSPAESVPTLVTVWRGAWEKARRDSLRILRLLGEGESARVFEVELPEGERVALKWARPGFEERVAEEARVLCLLDGTIAPRFFELVRFEAESTFGELGFLLELVEEDARGFVGEERSAPELVERVYLELGAGLEEVHAAGLSHGDLKPSHLRITNEGRLVLLDWGLAGSAGERPLLGGTPRYLPPEWRRGGRTSGAAADSYAWALCLLEGIEPSARGHKDLQERIGQRLPEPWEARLRPFLAENPAERASLLGASRAHEDPSARSAREQRAITRAYVSVREVELRGLASRSEARPRLSGGGALQAVLERTLELFGVYFQKRGSLGDGALLGDLSEHERRRFLARLLGPWIWEVELESSTDERLVSELLAFVRTRPLASWSGLGDVASAGERAGAPLPDGALPRADLASEDDLVSAAFHLFERPLSRATIDLVEERAVSSPRLRLELARALRRRGELLRALFVLGEDESPEALLERGILALRQGAREGASFFFEHAARAGEGLVRAQSLAWRARLHFDAGDWDAALALLEGQEGAAQVGEVRALVLWARGELHAAEDELLRARARSLDEEQRARLDGVSGLMAHARGVPDAALLCFSRAADAARRVGALLEEATYLTGVASAASDAGQLDMSLRAAARASGIFESLGKKREQAHALLARASVFALLGAETELRRVVEEGLPLARDTGDALCAGYFELCLVDGSRQREARVRAAERASAWLGESQLADRVRAAARLLELGLSLEEGGDERARQVEAREARIDWWQARARASLDSPERADVVTVIEELLVLSAEARSSISLGPALVCGAELALLAGRAQEARRLFAAAAPLAQKLLNGVGEDLRARASELGWVQKAGSLTRPEFASGQLEDVESLLRALSQREGLRSLFRQILDVLLLWTGVERGLLLLRAPGDRLVVRAARNLRKADLTEEQLALSQSLAERAMRDGRPVVAVDAAGDLSESHKSVHALRLRSVLAVPLLARGEVLGVAYLDDRVRRGAFGAEELSWAGLIGTVAALTIQDERDRLQLARVARRAQRAELRVTSELEKREAELSWAQRELRKISRGSDLRGNYSKIIGQSPALLQLLSLVDKVALSEVPVLITGESGTGKELIARALADNGPRKGRPFVAENCAALPETLLESTLFGHVKGAFTGALRAQSGLLEIADGGTLLLDEIGEMSLATQAKLLRFLQEGEVRPVGSERVKRVNVRILAATHRDLEAAVREGRFREDLFYRLHVIRLHVPALRERPEDILLLAEHFFRAHGGGTGRRFSRRVRERFLDYPWPGNVRQLENEVRRLVVLGGEEITSADLSAELQAEPSPSVRGGTLREQVDALERRLVLEALEQTRGNRTRAAELLGLSRFGLQKMMQRLEISEPA